MTRDVRGPGLRVAVAGLGVMGRNHLRNLLVQPDLEIAAVADPEPEATAAANEALASSGRDQAAVFADPLEMLRAQALDAIIVATPTTSHAHVALAAIESGVAVLVEKPLAATISEGEALIEAATDCDVLLQVGHIERFNPAVRALIAELAEGALTRIYSVKTLRCGPMPERIRDVGVAIDLATHDVDLICHLVGEMPTRVYAEMTRHVHTSHEDLLTGLLAFASGAVGQLDVNWLTPDKHRRLQVLGEEGMFEVDFLRQELSFTRGSRALEATYLGGYAPTFAGDRVALPVTNGEPLRLEQDAFLSAVRDGGPSPVSGREGLVALALADLLLQSASSHQSIAIEGMVAS